MGNKAYMRRITDQLCLHTDDIIPDIPIGGVIPEPEFFGATGLPGTTAIAADAGHRHAMPDLTDLLTDDVLFNEDLMLTTPTNVLNLIGTNPAIGGRDVIGPLGAFGSADIRTGNNATGSATLILQNVAAATGNTAIHLWQRVKQLIIRCSPGLVTTDISFIKFVVGGWLSTATTSTTAMIDNLSDGVFFRLDTDTNGVGNWFAVAMNNTTETAVDTGVPAVIIGTDVGFQQFEIDYDHTLGVATFLIDNIEVATVGTNIPPSTRKLAGFAPLMQSKDNGGSRQVNFSVDRYVLIGHRVAPA